MNRDRITGKCRQWIGTMQAQWGRLTDDAATMDAGERAQFAGRIQQRYGEAKEQAELELRDFFERNRDWNPGRR